MSVAPAFSRLARRRYRLRPVLVEAGSIILGIVLLIWSLMPVYNMFQIALDPEEGEIEFTGDLWPPHPSLAAFRAVVTQQARYLEDFWHQFGNSLLIGLSTMVLTVLIGSLASFAVSRLRLSKGSLLTNSALLTYAIQTTTLKITAGKSLPYRLRRALEVQVGLIERGRPLERIEVRYAQMPAPVDDQPFAFQAAQRPVGVDLRKTKGIGELDLCYRQHVSSIRGLADQPQPFEHFAKEVRHPGVGVAAADRGDPLTQDRASLKRTPPQRDSEVRMLDQPTD